MRGEISYDLVMEEEMDFVEGTYRLPGGEWQVFIFTRADDIAPCCETTRWESGATGVVVKYPRAQRLNKAAVEAVLSKALGVSEWNEARGPDSMRLR